MVKQCMIEIRTPGQGLHLVTEQVAAALGELNETQSSVGPGFLNIFVTHTSASLVIQENADKAARADLNEFLNRLVPEGQSWHRHLDEGPDDTVSHMKSALTHTSLSVPTRAGRMLLGTWQGIYLWEHRRHPHLRKIIVSHISSS